MPVAVAADPELYGRVLSLFGDALIEDPGITAETEPLLRAHAERLVWDAPFRSVADLETLPFPARCVNVKPSRFGSLGTLLDVYDHCKRAGIRMFGGGQLELGPGRRQIQLLASLFHPDEPNDVAPVEFNEPRLRAGLPGSPLRVEAAAGFYHP